MVALIRVGQWLSSEGPRSHQPPLVCVDKQKCLVYAGTGPELVSRAPWRRGPLTALGFSVEVILSPGDCWRYLEIFLVVTSGGGGFTIGSYLVGCGQGCS